MHNFRIQEISVRKGTVGRSAGSAGEHSCGFCWADIVLWYLTLSIALNHSLQEAFAMGFHLVNNQLSRPVNLAQVEIVYPLSIRFYRQSHVFAVVLGFSHAGPSR